MPRPERPLDQDNAELARFAADLRGLRIRAGRPAYRVLAGRAHYSATTLSDAAGGRQLPSLSVTLGYVRACGGDAMEWERRWHTLACQLVAAATDEPAKQETAPYVGLATFEPSDADRFFGRTGVTTMLIDRVRAERLVTMFGASGAGKSSVLRAGLIAHMREFRSAEDATPIVLFSPGQHPIEECAIALAALTKESVFALKASLSADVDALHLHIRTALPQDMDTDLLLVVDQFEEVFTLCQDRDERARFIAALVRAARHPSSRARVVLGVRTDFYTHCASDPDLAEVLRDGEILLSPMNADELRRAITQPVVRAGCTVEGALLATVVAECAGQPGVLPLLSHAMLETWRRRRGTTLTLAGYQASGGITHAIARTADHTYEQLDPKQQRLATALFLRLTALGDGTEDTKRRVRRDELDTADPNVDTVLERLAKARLITLDRDHVEITHEALIRSWPRLHGWLAEDRDRLRAHRQLTDAARTWESLARDRDALFRGCRLDGTRDWATGTDVVLSTSEQAFLTASLRAESDERAAIRRRTRRLRRLVILLSVLLVLTTVATGYAVRSQRIATSQRDIADAQSALREATSVQATDPALAMQLTLAAYRLAPGPGTLTGLLDAVASWPSPLVSPASADSTAGVNLSELTQIRGGAGASGLVAAGPHSVGYTLPIGEPVMQGQFDGVTELWGFTDLLQAGSHVVLGGNIPAIVNVDVPGETVAGYPLAFNQTAKIVATGGAGTSRLWNVADPSRPRPLAALPGVTLPVAISPDGQTLAAIGDLGDAQVWHVADPPRPRRLPDLDQRSDVSAMTFSPDGRTLATAAYDGSVRLWDMTNPVRLAARLPFGDDASLAYTPDGHTLATSTIDGTVRLWDLTDRGHPVQLSTLAGTPGVNDTIVISPDGHTLAIAGAIQTTRLWDIHDRAHPALLAVLTGAGSPVAFAPDGHALVVIDPTGRVIPREINVRDAAAAACALQHEAGSAALVLNAGTWGQYFPDLPYQPPCP